MVSSRQHPIRGRQLIWAGVGCWALTSCAGSTAPGRQDAADFRVAMSAADALEREQQLDPAERQLWALVEWAPEGKRDALRLRACGLRARDGNGARARACYRHLSTTLSSAEAVGQARYRAAALGVQDGDRAGAEQTLRSLLEDHPGVAAAHRALTLLRSLARQEGGAGAERRVLRDVADGLRRRRKAGALSSAEQQLLVETLVEAGRVAMGADGGTGEAVALLAEACSLPEPGPWKDDCLYHGARANRAAGDANEAIRLFDELIDDQEISWFVGSYDSAFLDDAMLEKAETLEAEGRLEAARAAYRRLTEDMPSSRLVDDAVFRAARLSFLAGDRAPLRAFVLDFADSRHAAAARALLKEGDASAAPR